ncbi:hypothetical protein PIROE2DRAFT_63642 [Piromyces sp. E2]|nr:hypothetical protein PIROE2DRAFT_63642 [Piromyces sp. E2]|eukprot:OUM59626.1 hypothetical protein PIROE2DRAFT_63642 [Piromyces sp. E2]
MKYFSKIISLSTLLVLSVGAPIEQEKDKTVKILTDKPDSITADKWNDYCISMKNFFTTTKNENPIIRDYDIDFSYNKDEIYDKKSTNEYESYINNIIRELKSNTYDMMILDDKFLFADNAFVSSDYVDTSFSRDIHNEYLELTNDVNKETLSFHDNKILNDGYYNNHLYALPFEKDFDVIYYRKDNANLSSADMTNVSWDALAEMKGEGAPNTISVASGNDDELLNLFLEYTNEKINLTDKDKESNYAKLYNDNSKDIYNAFSTFTSKITENNNFEVTQDNAYKSFIGKSSAVYKGKASQYRAIFDSQNGNNIMMKLPPKNVSVISKKYLVINKNSLLDKKVLIEVALKLTSREMQLYKAEQFGKFPTFDLNQRGSDPSIKTYAEKNFELLNLMNRIIPLHLKDVFSSKFSAPFMEIRALLPQDLRNYLKSKKDEDLFNVFENTQKLLMDKSKVIHIPTYFLYAPIFIFTVFALTVIATIIKYRNYPCLKIFSPGFCILSILGLIMNIISPIFTLGMNDPKMCKFNYTYDTLYTDLTLFPMVAVTYRLYTIYRSKARDNKIKNLNTRIYIFFIIGMISMVVYSAICSFFIHNYYFLSYGTIDTYRQPVCKYTDSRVFEFIERRVNELIINYQLMVISDSI